MKIDPNHPTIRVMLLIMLVYAVSSFVLNTFVQSDYDYEKSKQEIMNAKKSEDLVPITTKIETVSKTRFYVHMCITKYRQKNQKVLRFYLQFVYQCLEN